MNVILMALLASTMVILVRWVGAFSVLYFMGAGARSSTLATINISQVGEFSLVIVALGKSLHHVHDDTMAILIWTFSILAVLASYLIGYNDKIYNFLNNLTGMSDH